MFIYTLGYYKPDPYKEYTENDKVEPFDFLSEVSRDWEAAAVLPANIKTRLVILRSGEATNCVGI